jgi:hypothetical protein
LIWEKYEKEIEKTINKWELTWRNTDWKWVQGTWTQISD